MVEVEENIGAIDGDGKKKRKKKKMTINGGKGL